jgi:hypothetical protein
MNKIYSCLLIGLFSIGMAQAQAPSKFSYQAVVRDASGALINKSPVGIQISLYKNATSGTAVYVERHTANSNANGLISIEIGSGTLQSGNFSTIDWGNNNYFIKSEMDPNGGTSYTVELSNQLLSVPYALYANSSAPQKENDPEFKASSAASITSSNITDWDNDLVDDADSDPANEIQDLDLTGTILTITNNGSATSIDLSGYLDNTDTSVLTEAQVDAYVGNNGFLTTEIDGDTTNEIQTLTQVGDSLFLSNSGGAVSISGSDTSVWESHKDGNIYTLNKVAIGTDRNYNVAMFLQDTLTKTRRWGSYTRAYSGDTAATGILSGQIAIVYDKSAGIKRGLDGEAYGASPENQGVFGRASGSAGRNTGVLGVAAGNAAVTIGLDGYASGDSTWNVGALANASNGIYNRGLEINLASSGKGTLGSNIGVLSYASLNPNTNISVYGGTPGTAGTTNLAGFFEGDVTVTGDLNVTGSIAKGSGTFKIDHPLDPENKYLVHSFIESPKMLNIYNGKITTDAKGFAVVTLPEYVEAANKDFLYQLTVIGTFAQAIVKEELQDNQFLIQTNLPNVAVCWELTGVRADKYAEENRVIPELEKEKKGTYLHPELYNEPKEKSENFEILQSPSPSSQNSEKNSSVSGG